MKKSLTKTLSAFLALVLILSALPMAAFAAEVEGIAPASIICEDGKHIYAVEGVVFYTDKGEYHLVEVYDACAVCGYRRSLEPIRSHNEVHENVETYLGIDPEVGLPKYEIYCQLCGHTEYEYK